MIPYLIRSVLLTGAAYMVYVGLFKVEKTFTFNRLYLLISLIICLSFPAYHLLPNHVLPRITRETLSFLSDTTSFDDINPIGQSVEVVKPPIVDWVSLFITTYSLVTIVLIMRYFRKISSIDKKWYLLHTFF